MNHETTKQALNTPAILVISTVTATCQLHYFAFLLWMIPVSMETSSLKYAQEGYCKLWSSFYTRAYDITLVKHFAIHAVCAT